jgi:hypothetical protein
LEDKLGDVVKVACKRGEEEEWVFEREPATSDTGQDAWRMTSPLQMKCVRWEVDKFGNQLGSLQYELSYKPGEPGAIAAAAAGLDPPEATITLTGADGKTATVEIGNAASDNETYVRLAGSDEICVGKSKLRNLIKDRAIEYRDKQLWDFVSDDVQSVEIVDRSDPDTPVTYVFNRDGARWMMASPVTARATSKVDDMVRELGRLRALTWHDDDARKLGAYGLEPAALVVRATVEEEVPVEEEERDTEEAGEENADSEAEDEPETETKLTVYELHLSDRSPIAEETKTYMRVGDESAVATVTKTTADKFKPVMSEWREMQITAANVNGASRIEMTTAEGPATLVKVDGAWTFETDGGRAEDAAVADLLTAIVDLNAVVFVDDAPADLAQFGLDQPRAEIRLTVPGIEGVERIAVGDYTDEQTKRLVYVRRNELTSIAKVRSADVVTLLRSPRLYRDRSILDVLPSRFERIALSTENPFVGGRDSVVFQRDVNTWNMVEPVTAGVREDQMDKLVEALGGLRAEEVVADEGEPSAFGLHDPSVTIALTYKPPVEYRVEEPVTEDRDESGADTDGQEPVVPVEVQPPSKTLELAITGHDGKYYAKRSDQGTIHEVTGDFYKQLVASYRADRVMDFESDKVLQFSIRTQGAVHVFERQDDRWVYQAEPDLPLDSNKVENLLLQIRDLRTDRYVRHVVDDPAAYGLAEPASEVAVSLDDGASRMLLVSGQEGDDGVNRGFYASVEGAGSGVFLLTADSTRRFEVVLDELE